MQPRPLMEGPGGSHCWDNFTWTGEVLEGVKKSLTIQNKNGMNIIKKVILVGVRVYEDEDCHCY